MAFRQHRPQPSRQLSIPTPQETSAEVGPTTSSPLRKRALDQSEEWVLFSPAAPSTTARTHTTSTDRTPRTAGLSRYSDFGSLDTAARSEQDDDLTQQGTEEAELDSLDDGLHAFHEPSDYGAPATRLQQSGETVLPTHDGLGAFQADATMQDHLWQFERQSPRRRHARRRSSVQRRLDALDEAEDLQHEHDRRQRIEQWRLEQSRALLEEIERESRRMRRMSVASAARGRNDSAHTEMTEASAAPGSAQSVSDSRSVSSDENTEDLSFWQRLTRRVIRDLIGLDEDTLSVIFGEALPEEVSTRPSEPPAAAPGTTEVSAPPSARGEAWEHRLLERVARELGILVHQLSEHPGAFSTYLRTRDEPEYAGLGNSVDANASNMQPTHRAPQSATPAQSSRYTSVAQQPPVSYSEASLWGIEEEPGVDPLDSSHPPSTNMAEDLVREQEYWERELDVKMVFNFLVQRFSSRRPPTTPHHNRNLTDTRRRPSATTSEAISARRAAIIRQHHPLVNTDRLPSASATREARRREPLLRQHLSTQASMRGPQALRSSSSCASHSTKKSKRSAGSNRNYWDLGGSVGSGSVIASEA